MFPWKPHFSPVPGALTEVQEAGRVPARLASPCAHFPRGWCLSLQLPGISPRLPVPPSLPGPALAGTDQWCEGLDGGGRSALRRKVGASSPFLQPVCGSLGFLVGEGSTFLSGCELGASLAQGCVWDLSGFGELSVKCS